MHAAFVLVLDFLFSLFGAVFAEQFEDEDENEDEQDVKNYPTASSFIIPGPLPPPSNLCTSFDNMPTIRNSISFPACT